MSHWLRLAISVMLALGMNCASPRHYYLRTDLPYLEGEPDLAVVPGPWAHGNIAIVVSDMALPPDELVLPVLQEMMSLPGAANACDPNTGVARPDAAEYCVAIYKTPRDWRVSWPIRDLTGQRASCKPPFGGVDDEEYGKDLPVFGFAHNHPCGTNMSSPDLVSFPALRAGDGHWMMVSYATSPGGKLARDSQGSLIPAWHWLATGHRDEPRFYKWNSAGEVFRWVESTRNWQFQAICHPQQSSLFGSRVLLPKCSPTLN